MGILLFSNYCEKLLQLLGKNDKDILSHVYCHEVLTWYDKLD